MPWKRSSETSGRVQFVSDYQKYVLSGELTMSALCAEHQISRKTGYKIVSRFELGGMQDLADRSRAPIGGEHWSDPELITRVLSLRQQYGWGAKKILSSLRSADPDEAWPVVSVVHEWIRKADLITRVHKQRRFKHPGAPLQVPIIRPNQQWSTDFKGHFKTRDRRYCYPLTVTDSYSRFIVGIAALKSTSFELTWSAYERLFRQFGLPESILSDNGSPFASNSVRRLSKLSVRWIRLNIEPRLTQPGKPQQNGRHERMHREFKKVICSEPAANLKRQQIECNHFVDYYNQIRPHEGIGQALPADLYKRSSREYPRRLPELEYPVGWQVRRVRSSGDISWKGQWFYLSEPLVGERVAFEQIDDSCWVLRFGKYELGHYSEKDRQLHLDRHAERTAAAAEN